MTRARELVLAALVAGFAAVSLGGCLIVWAVSQDPEGLPCATGDRECLVGYTCVEGKCRRAAAIEEGGSCVEDEECADGLVCTNVYEDGECLDPNYCGIGAGSEDGSRRRCRRVCNPNQDPKDQCAPGQICWRDLDGSGWCQAGVCSAPSDCGTNPANGQTNICYGAAINPQGSGLCTSACDPLECNPTTGCPDCPLADLNGDGVQEVMGCEPFEGILNNMGCIQAGDVPHGQPCDGVNTFCQPGAFCLVPQGSTAGFCSRICRVGGGNPACDAAQPTCNNINGVFGFCS